MKIETHNASPLNCIDFYRFLSGLINERFMILNPGCVRYLQE